MQVMNDVASAVFRSKGQARLLAVLFGVERPALSVSELARRSGVSQPTASREVTQLELAGVVTSTTEGRNRVVSAAWEQPWAPDLANLVAKTAGVPAQVAAVLRDVPGVDEAFIFGSWAARQAGQPGPAPRDIDVLVVGEPDPVAIRRACRALSRQIASEVNAVVVTRERWDSAVDDSFIDTVKSAPILRVVTA